MDKKNQNNGNLQGNSLSEDTLAEITKRNNLKKGEMKKKDIKLSEGVDSEYLEVLDNVLGDYEKALYSLKDK